MGLQRVLILMTDGQNDVTSTSSAPGQEVTYFNGLSGVGTNNLHAPSASSTLANGSIVQSDIDSYQAAVCTAIKNAGITIYTIAFGAGAAGTSLQSCASPGDYYVASSNSSLNAVFQQIASNIAVLTLRQ